MGKSNPDHNTCSDLSIALCTCEGSFYLPEQLESLAGQSLMPGELVICDDVSQDNSVEIVSEFASNAPFAVSLHVNKTRQGAIKSFNRAISLCRGKYVALCDQDDIWHRNRLKLALSALQDAEKSFGDTVPLLAHSDMVLIGKNGAVTATSFMRKRKISHLVDDPLQGLVVQNFVTGNTVLFNSALKELALPIPERAVMHDWWLALLAAAAGKIVFINKPTVFYRQHDTNLIGANDYYSIKNISRAADLKRLEKDLAGTIMQAEALRDHLINLELYEPPLWLCDYLSSARRGGIKAVKTVLRSRISKPGLIRNIFFLLLLFKGGYRKYLS